MLPQFEYDGVNGFLRGLHSEQLARRQSLPAGQLESLDMEPEPLTGSGTTAANAAPVLSQAMTHFSLADVVQCGHSPAGRCLQCSGRLVENVPLAAYSAFSRAYSATTASSSSSSFPCQSFGDAETSQSVELSFAAFVALAAGLRPQPGERLLHLGSGAGRAVLTWALLLPQSAACGVESSLALHRTATSAQSQLEPDIQQRIFLRHGDMFSVQSDWCQANVIIISAGSLGERAASSLAQGLSGAASGTRVVCLSQPLSSNRSRVPAGFTLAKEAVYRTASAGNTTAYIYRKS